MADRYEYMLTNGRLGPSEERGRAFQAELNEFGSKGWRVVGMSGDILSASILLERPLAQHGEASDVAGEDLRVTALGRVG